MTCSVVRLGLIASLVGLTGSLEHVLVDLLHETFVEDLGVSRFFFLLEVVVCARHFCHLVGWVNLHVTRKPVFVPQDLEGH